DILYCPNKLSISFSASLKRFSNHFEAVFCAWEAGLSIISHPFTKRKAFHILLAKFRPCVQYATSNIKSFPAGEESNIPTRTPSVPYLSISSIGSGELPKDLDILRPSLSRTIPVRYTFSKGGFPVYSCPKIIILATQKNRISGAVTKSFVG